MFTLMCYFVCVVNLGDSAKILGVLTFPSLSHNIAFQPYIEELARRGHDVTVITTDPYYVEKEAPTNIKEIDLHKLSYEKYSDTIKKTVTGTSDIFGQIKKLLDALNLVFEAQLQMAEVQKLINETKEFDLIVIDSCSRPPLIFTHIFKGPVIAFSTVGRAFFHDDMFGIPTHPLIYPSFLNQRIYNLSIMEKFIEIYKYVQNRWFFKFHQFKKEDEMFKRLLGPDTPNLFELGKNVDMFFINVHPVWYGHPKIKLFITQGGLQSTEEAIMAGVPLIGVPMLIDQWFNAEKYEHHRIGKKLNIETLTEDDVEFAIETIMADNSYRENVVRLGALIQDDPHPALDKAIWWSEYVIRHKGAKHLRSPAANMTWWEYYEMSIVLSVLLALLVVLLIIVMVLRFVLRLFFSFSNKIKNE